MATESSRIIFNIEHAPSPKSFMVTIPMNMYRIKTYAFEPGLDFFQRSVLKLKANPRVTNTKIAECLGLDEELVDQIVRVLQYNNYVDSNGFLTQKGIETKKTSTASLSTLRKNNWDMFSNTSTGMTIIHTISRTLVRLLTWRMIRILLSAPKVMAVTTLGRLFR